MMADARNAPKKSINFLYIKKRYFYVLLTEHEDFWFDAIAARGKILQNCGESKDFVIFADF